MTHAIKIAFTSRARLAGREMPRLGLGCGRVGSFNNPATLSESQELCAAALNSGVTLFDTADVYGQGDSERVLGRLLRSSGSGASPIIVTKVGLTFSWKARLMGPLKPAVRALVRRHPSARSAVSAQRAGAMSCNFSPNYLQHACAASRRRLGVPRIDALLLHGPSAATLADGRAVDAMRSLRNRGEIAAFGASLDNAEAVNVALGINDLEVVEITPHLLFGLSGAQRKSIARRGIVVLLREVLRQASPEQPPCAALSVALTDPLVTTVVVGTTSRRHLDDLVAAL